MTQPVEIYFLVWPWSIFTASERIPFTDGLPCDRYTGTSLIASPSDAHIILQTRHEKLPQVGPTFVGRAGKQHFLVECPNLMFRIKGKASRRLKAILPTHSIQAPFGDSESSDINKDQLDAVEGWSQVFDELIDSANDRAHESSSAHAIRWDNVLSFFKYIETRQENREPRHALIVAIAERLGKDIAEIVRCARRVLSRKREMVSLNRYRESDTACIKWYMQQSGSTAIEKAGAKQVLLGVTRTENFDTLENRVLKAFLKRCSIEAQDYVRTQTRLISSALRSPRIGLIKSFRNACEEALRSPCFSEVQELRGLPQPNYALQHDRRYKEIWKWYQRLLRKEREADCLWDWQGRTWADIARLLVCASLEFVKSGAGNAFTSIGTIEVDAIVDAALSINREQDRGSRIVPETLPGPYLLLRKSKNKRYVLEIVHSENAKDHPQVSALGNLGAHCTIVASTVGDRSQRKVLVAIWGIHSAAASFQSDAEDIKRSLEVAISSHQASLRAQYDLHTELFGVALISSTSPEPERDIKVSDNLVIVPVSVDASDWLKSLGHIAEQLEYLLARAFDD